MGAVPPCDRSHWGLPWSSLWGDEKCQGCAEMGAVPPCKHSRWGPRWSSLWGHEACEGCAEMEVELHADPATWALGGASYGVTKRVRGVPKSGGGGVGALGLGPSVEHPVGLRNV